MKKRYLLFLLLYCLQGKPLYAQQIIHFDAPVSGELLEGTHRSAVHVDSTQAVFHQQEAWVKEYKKMYGAFSKHLKAGGLELSKPLHLNVRCYFRPDGSIGHIAYKYYAPNDLDAMQAKLFNQLLEAFARDYKVSFSAKEPFKQCGPVLLQANVEGVNKP